MENNMFVCNFCNFVVSNKLKYSLKNNMCPACGAALFKDSEMRLISSASISIKNEEFSQSLDDVIINDMALFIFNNYLKPDIDVDNSKLSDAGADGTLDEMDDIRREVSGEYPMEESIDAAGESLGDEYHKDDDDDDYKIARLKRMAQEAGEGGKNISVRRVD